MSRHAGIVARRPWRWIVLLAAVALTGVLAAPARAEVLVFTGESLFDSANWNNGENWRRSDGSHGVPGGGDDAIIPGGIAGPILSSGASGAARRISLAGNLQVKRRNLTQKEKEVAELQPA